METEKNLENLVKKYDSPAHMYTEYPHKSFWSEEFKESDYKESLNLLSSDKKNDPMMMYVHIPYCTKPCFFCTCHFKVTNDHGDNGKIKNYLSTLSQEIDLLGNFFDKNSINPKFLEMHLGGGSPTILNEGEFDYLIEKINNLVKINDLEEFAIEIDPRAVNRERMLYYHEKGINRISFGIQDFDPKVQEAINRVQSPEMVGNLITSDIRSLFKHGINFDVIYGLPLQTKETIRETFKKIIELSPDRIAFYPLGYNPEFAKHQEIMIDGRNGRPNRLPDSFEKRMLFFEGLKILTDNNYLRIGYDHFTKADNELAKAAKNKETHWRALGVNIKRDVDMIGIGPNGTSTIGDFYSQNYYLTEGYEEHLEKERFPTYRGHIMSKNDRIRREIIFKLRNSFSLDFENIDKEHNIDSKEYFKNEITRLEGFARDGILNYSNNRIEVTDLGKEFILNVCDNFDDYIHHE